MRGFFEPRIRSRATSRALRSLEASPGPAKGFDVDLIVFEENSSSSSEPTTLSSRTREVYESFCETRWLTLRCSSERLSGCPTVTNEVQGSSRDPKVPVALRSLAEHRRRASGSFESRFKTLGALPRSSSEPRGERTVRCGISAVPEAVSSQPRQLFGAGRCAARRSAADQRVPRNAAAGG